MEPNFNINAFPFNIDEINKEKYYNSLINNITLENLNNINNVNISDDLTYSPLEPIHQEREIELNLGTFEQKVEKKILPATMTLFRESEITCNQDASDKKDPGIVAFQFQKINTHENKSIETFTQIVKLSEMHKYCDITDYLCLPQSHVAKILKMRPSTFSKRWKEATRGRCWPYRTLTKINNEIELILNNIVGENISAETDELLRELLEKKKKILVPVRIRI